MTVVSSLELNTFHLHEALRANCCLISKKLFHYLITLKPINLLYISRAIFVFITGALLMCERFCNCVRVNQRREQEVHFSPSRWFSYMNCIVFLSFHGFPV